MTPNTTTDPDIPTNAAPDQPVSGPSPGASAAPDTDSHTGPQGSPTDAGASSGANTGSAAFLDAEGRFVDGWLDRLPPELAEARGTLGRYQTFAELAKGLHNANQALGRRTGQIAMPNETTSAEEIAAFRNAMDVPDSAEEYGLEPPQELPEGLEWNEDSAGDYLAILHRHHAPRTLVRELFAHRVAESRQQFDATRKQEAEHMAAQKQALAAQWGGDYEHRMQRARRGAAALGLDLGNPIFNQAEVIQAMERVEGMIGEDQLVSGRDSHDAPMTPRDRARDIMTNPQNPHYGRYQRGDEAVVEMVTGLLREAS